MPNILDKTDQMYVNKDKLSFQEIGSMESPDTLLCVNHQSIVSFIEKKKIKIAMDKRKGIIII